MERDRLTAFTDGVLAVIITIMVLEMKPPHGTGLADLAELAPVFLSYLLSFVYIGIYWSNHHHFFQLVQRVDGYVATLVSGVPVFENGEYTGATPGKLVRATGK